MIREKEWKSTLIAQTKREELPGEEGASN